MGRTEGTKYKTRWPIDDEADRFIARLDLLEKPGDWRRVLRRMTSATPAVHDEIMRRVRDNTL